MSDARAPTTDCRELISSGSGSTQSLSGWWRRDMLFSKQRTVHEPTHASPHRWIVENYIASAGMWYPRQPGAEMVDRHPRAHRDVTAEAKRPTHSHTQQHRIVVHEQRVHPRTSRCVRQALVPGKQGDQIHPPHT